MDWSKAVMDIIGVGATAASGGVFGLVASSLSAFFKRAQIKADREFEKSKWVHEDKLFRLQMEQDAQTSEHELAIVAQAGSWKALDSSYNSMRKTGISYKWVDAIKDLFRPALTTMLILCTMYIFYRLVGILEGNSSTLSTVLGQTQAIELMLYIIYSVVFSTSTAIVWWFGDRAMAPPGMKNR